MEARRAHPGIRWSTVCIGLLLLEAAARNLGTLRPEVARAGLVLGLILLLLLGGTWRRLMPTRGSLVALPLLLAGALSIPLLSGPVPHLACLALAFLGLALGFSMRSEEDPGFGALAWTTSLYLVLVILYLSSPVAYHALEAASRGWSRLATGLVGDPPLALGASVSGFWSMLGLAAFVLVRTALLARRLTSFLLLEAALLLLHTGYLLALALSSSPLLTQERMLWLGELPFIAGLALIVLAGSGDRAPREPDPAASPRQAWKAAVAGLAGAACVLGLIALPIERPVREPRVLLYSVNEGELLDWRAPGFDYFGAYSVGMFGMLPRYLEADGFEVDFQRESLTREALSGVDALVLINTTVEWREEELRAIWEYVLEGGNLLVMGDHTGVGGLQECENRLLAPYRDLKSGIALEFDSTYPVGQTWKPSWLFPGTVSTASRDADDHGISVGASLRLDSAACVPLLVGRHGLGDVGNMLDEGGAFLGDYQYQKGEVYGDLVLAAARYMGRGKVLVFGDTSSFQNAGLPFVYLPFVREVMLWLTASRGWWSDWLPAGLTAVLLAALVAATWTGRARPLSFHVAVGLLVLAYFGAQAWHGFSRPFRSETDRLALIDDSHLERVDGGMNSKNPVGSLYGNFYRNDFLPILTRRFDTDLLGQSRVFVTIAPARRPRDVREVVDRARSPSHANHRGAPGTWRQLGDDGMQRSRPPRHTAA